MSRESIIIDVISGALQPVVYHYECFGWELNQVAGNRLVFSRETQDTVYQQLVNYERDYIALDTKKKALIQPLPPQKNTPFNLFKCILLFILLIIPGILYIVKFNKEKKEYEERVEQYNQALHQFNEETRDLTNKMSDLECLSRSVFFGKRIVVEHNEISE